MPSLPEGRMKLDSDLKRTLIVWLLITAVNLTGAVCWLVRHDPALACAYGIWAVTSAFCASLVPRQMRERLEWESIRREAEEIMRAIKEHWELDDEQQ